jgi:hypothetical protein
MTMFRTVAYAFSVILLCTACEKIFDFPGNGKYKKNVVIEALISNQPYHSKVRVSYATEFNDSVSAEPISDASVKLVSTSGDTADFLYTADGWYTGGGFAAIPEVSYTLLVGTDTTLYRSTSTMIRVHGLDSLSYSFYRKINTTDSAYYLKLYAGPTDPDTPRYYQIQIYKNNQLITTGKETLLVSDFGTSSLDGFELNIGFARYDTLDVELYSLTEDMFYYYLYIFNSILFNTNYDLEYKTNPPICFTPKALGYFQLSDLSRKRIIIR